MIPGTIQPARFLTDTGQIRPGVRQVINVPNPAAGADWTYTVPGGQMVKVVCGTFIMSIGSDGGTEIVSLALTSAGVTVGRVVCVTSTDASTSGDFTFSQVGGPMSSNGTYPGGLVNLPDYVLSSGDTIGTVSTNLVADDQFSAINLLADVYYFTDEQLSTLEVQKQAAELVYVQQLEQQLSRQ